MTYDPKLPDPGLGRNPPQYRQPDSFGPSSIVAMILGAVVIVGAIAYAVSGPSTNTASNPPPTTTGQGVPATPTNTAPPEAAPPAPKEPRIDN
jgi:hypothetical protein